MAPWVLFIIALTFLVGTSLLTALSSGLRSIHKRESEKQLKALGNHFWYRKFHCYFFPEDEYETISFAVTSAQNITRFFFATFSIVFLMQTQAFQSILVEAEDFMTPVIAYCLATLWIIAFLLLSFVLGDYMPRIFGTRFPETSLKRCAPYSAIFLFTSFPITYLFLKFTHSISRSVYFDHLHEPDSQAKQEIIEIVQEAELSEELDENEKKLITSVLSFCEHLTREVMIPRVDLFSLEANTSIKDATKLLEEEGYSRVPIYKETVDNITGILMYKDVLAKYMEYEAKGNDNSIIDAPISSIQKTPLYTPETKKISDLLQEFRCKQTHIAIVVDEYGGTEGIITIEDILEDIVGEIADEYDEEEELYTSLPNGTWIADPRMSLLDAEEQLGIKVPQDGDYDTIGGYIFHCAGEIPKRGFTVQSDEFEIIVLKSSDRSIKKIRITSLTNPDNPETSGSA